MLKSEMKTNWLGMELHGSNCGFTLMDRHFDWTQFQRKRIYCEHIQSREKSPCLKNQFLSHYSLITFHKSKLDQRWSKLGSGMLWNATIVWTPVFAGNYQNWKFWSDIFMSTPLYVPVVQCIFLKFRSWAVIPDWWRNTIYDLPSEEEISRT